MGSMGWSILAVFLVKIAQEDPAAPPGGKAWIGLALTALAVVIAWKAMPRLANSPRRTLRRLPAAAGALTLAAALFPCGWLAWLDVVPGGRWPWAETILALAPFLLVEGRSIWVQMALGGLRGAHLRRATRLRAGIEFLPLILFVLFDGLLACGSAIPWLRIAAEQIEALQWLLFLAGILFLLVALPGIARVVWSLQSLPAGALRSRLLAIGDRLGFTCRGIYLWPTAHCMANAAVLGMGGRLRMVLFSDLLLARLDDEQIASVFAHEAGHVSGRHMRRFAILAALMLVVGMQIVERTSDPAVLCRLGPWCSAREVPHWALQSGIFLPLLACAALWWLVFGKISRLAEHEADLLAAQAMGSEKSFCSALLAVCASTGHPLGHRAWRHPSPLERVSLLRRIWHQPGAMERYRRRLRTMHAGIAIALIAALGWKVWDSAERFPAEVIRTELGLGAFAWAQRHAALLGDPRDREEVRRLIELGRAGALASRRGDPRREWIRRARQRATLGEFEEAQRLLFLASLALPGVIEPVLDAQLEQARFLVEAGFRQPAQRLLRWARERSEELDPAVSLGFERFLRSRAAGIPPGEAQDL